MQDKENTRGEKEARKGAIIKKGGTVAKPSKTAKPVSKKAIAGVVRTSKKPGVTGSAKAAADPAILEDVKAECPEIKKKHIKDRNICKTTFTLPGEAALEAGTVTIVGDFNNWDRDATPLKKLGNGNFAVTVELDAGKEYRFRYLIDGQRWENDWHADKYVKSPYGAEDSVVCT